MSDSAAARIVGELDQIDRAVYEAVAESTTPSLDEPLRRLSDFANYSKIWIAAALIVGAAGGSQGRRAALSGLVSIGVTSAAVNQGIKRLAERPRPDRDGQEHPET